MIMSVTKKNTPVIILQTKYSKKPFELIRLDILLQYEIIFVLFLFLRLSTYRYSCDHRLLKLFPLSPYTCVCICTEFNKISQTAFIMHWITKLTVSMLLSGCSLNWFLYLEVKLVKIIWTRVCSSNSTLIYFGCIRPLQSEKTWDSWVDQNVTRCDSYSVWFFYRNPYWPAFIVRLLYNVPIDFIFAKFEHHIGEIRFTTYIQELDSMSVKMFANNFAGLNFFRFGGNSPLWCRVWTIAWKMFVEIDLHGLQKLYWGRTPSIFKRKVWSECRNGDGEWGAYGALRLSNYRKEKTTVLQSTICIIAALEYKYCWLITI